MNRRAPLLWCSLVLVLVSVAAALYLADLHYRVYADPNYVAGCDINATFRCTSVALSPYAEVAGVPLAIWGLLGYAGFLFFIVLGLCRRGSTAWPAGLYWLLNAFTLVVSLVLAFVAEVVIGALCIGCLAMYVANFLLFVISCVLLRRHPGALRRDLSRPFADRAVIGCAAAVAIAGVGVAVAYPKYWEAGLPDGPTDVCDGPDGLAAGFNPDGSCWIGDADRPVLEITEFSDYRCPFCRRAHVQMRELVKKYRDRVRVTHKHFPLDKDCNPALKRQLHADACKMARMAYCAGLQGRFWPMNDRLFTLPESARLDPLALASEVGVDDTGAFLSCLDSRAAAEHVRRDIEEGLSLGITGTPTYLIDGKLHQGRIPAAILRRVQGSDPDV